MFIQTGAFGPFLAIIICKSTTYNKIKWKDYNVHVTLIFPSNFVVCHAFTFDYGQK